MADMYAVSGETLTGIANAIRGKTGSDDFMTVASMASAIEGIPSGGGSFIGRKIATGTFVPTSKTWGGTVTHADVGDAVAIFILCRNPKADGENLKRIGIFWIENDFSDVTDVNHVSNHLFIVYANKAITSSKRNNYRIFDVTRESFELPNGDTTYTWYENEMYDYLVIGDLI